MRKYVDSCTVKSLQLSDIEILASTNRGIKDLMTLEALFIREIDTELNTKDEYAAENLLLSFNYHFI